MKGNCYLVQLPAQQTKDGIKFEKLQWFLVETGKPLFDPIPDAALGEVAYARGLSSAPFVRFRRSDGRIERLR